MADVEQDRSLKIVVGYLASDRKLPERQAADLIHRTAFVLDSYRASKVDDYFDSELYAVLLETVRRVVGADRVTGIFDSGERVFVPSAEECRVLVRRTATLGADDEGDPFERVVFARGDRTVAVAGHEAYWKIGGPDPYHDSYTIPVYTREDLSEALVTEARVACSQLGAQITSVVRGAHCPRRRSIRDAVRWLLRLFVP